MHARPFAAGDRLYVPGQAGDLTIISSDDGGDSWSNAGDAFCGRTRAGADAGPARRRPHPARPISGTIRRARRFTSDHLPLSSEFPRAGLLTTESADTVYRGDCRQMRTARTLREARYQREPAWLSRSSAAPSLRRSSKAAAMREMASAGSRSATAAGAGVFPTAIFPASTRSSPASC